MDSIWKRFSFVCFVFPSKLFPVRRTEFFYRVFFYANCGRRFLFALIDDSTPVASHRNDNEKDTERERERESHEIEKRRHWSSSRSLPSFAVPGFVCVRRTQMRWHLVMQMSRDAVQSASPIANDALRLAGDVVSARQASSSFRSSFVFVCFVLFFVFFSFLGPLLSRFSLFSVGRSIGRRRLAAGRRRPGAESTSASRRRLAIPTPRRPRASPLSTDAARPLPPAPIVSGLLF